MKKTGILNRHLNQAIGQIGHGQILFIADAGFPIPADSKCVDLAVKQDMPTVTEIFELISHEMIYEKVIVAEEQKANNPNLFRTIEKISGACQVDLVPHEDILNHFSKNAFVFVRTGSFEPWGNIMLVSGINAPVWFSKPDVIVPENYKERVSRKNL